MDVLCKGWRPPPILCDIVKKQLLVLHCCLIVFKVDLDARGRGVALSPGKQTPIPQETLDPSICGVWANGVRNFGTLPAGFVPFSS